MRFVIAWRLVRNSAIYSRKTVFALALIIALIISMGGVVSGLGQYASDIILRAGSTPYLIIYENEKPLSDSLLPNRTLDLLNHPSIRLTIACRFLQAEQITRLKSSLVSSNISTLTIELSNATHLNFPIFATDVLAYLRFRNTSQVLVGNYPKSEDEKLTNESSIPSSDVINALVPSSLLTVLSDVGVGDVLLVNFSVLVKSVNRQGENDNGVSENVRVHLLMKLNVTGIYKASSLRDEAILVNFRQLRQKITELGDYYSFIEVLVDDPAEAINVKLAVQNSLQKQQIDAVIEEEQQSLTLLRLIMDAILEKLFLFVLFLYIIAGFRLLTAKLWLTILYQRELRILRVLGASPLYLAAIFFFIGSILFLLGFLLGLVIGVALPLMLTFLFQVSASFPLINYHPNPNDVLLLFIVGQLVVLATTLMLLPRFYDKNLVVPTTEIEI